MKLRVIIEIDEDGVYVA